MYITLFLGLTCVVAFAWGVKRHFRPGEGAGAGMTFISALTATASAWFVWRLATGPSWVLLPLAPVLFTGSLALFAWTASSTRQQRLTLAFSNDAPTFLNRTGPYRYIRHPFYSAYVLYWAGAAIASPEWLPWIFAFLMLCIYVSAAKQEEMKFRHSSLRASYHEYRLQTGMFTPRITRQSLLLKRY